jgi:hypothetical protein
MLGIPGSTLYSKIGSLRIDKKRFKITNPARDRSRATSTTGKTTIAKSRNF